MTDHEKLTNIITEYIAGYPNHFMYIMLNDEGNTSQVKSRDFAEGLTKVIINRTEAKVQA